MTVGEAIIYAAGILSACTVIFTCIFKWLIKPIKEMANHYKEDREEQKYCNKLTLAMAVHCKSFSDSERIEAGEHYIEYGGNGFTKAYVGELKRDMQSKVRHKVEQENYFEEMFNDRENKSDIN